MNSETGHAPSRQYADQNGELHLNGSALHVDESGSVISATQAVLPGATLAFSSVAALAAAGSTQANAAAIVTATAVVTGADGTKGVLLPTPSTVGQEITVINTNASSALKVWPDNGGTGGTIANGAANANASLAAAKGATYICTALAPSAWWSASN